MAIVINNYNMISNRELTFDEQRSVQLDILKEVDVVCRREKIKYSLAFGTLLGAIRHNGYIPWDDDLDIMMPYEDMIRLRDSLKSDKITFYDVDTDKTYGNAFGNICSNLTYRRVGRTNDRGIGIDVYPIVRIPNNSKVVNSFFEKAEKLQKYRCAMLRLRSFLQGRLSVHTIPFYHYVIKKFRNHLVSHNSMVSSRYYIIAGPLDMRSKMIYNEDLFNSLTMLQFEDGEFPGISNYDLFLTMRYGDYMQLPPKEQRHPYHGQHYYWK